MTYPNLQNSVVANLGWCTAKLVSRNAKIGRQQVKTPWTLIIHSPSFSPESPEMGPWEPPQEIKMHGREELIALRDFLNEHVLNIPSS